MIVELKKKEYPKVRSLFNALDYQLTIAAVIDGSSPGRIIADNPKAPTSAFICSVEGYYLAGDPQNGMFNQGLRDYILTTIFAGDTVRENDDDLVLCIHPEDWQTKFDTLFPTRPPLQLPRLYYTCTEVKIDWQKKIPTGFSIHQLEPTFLGKKNIVIPDHILNWMRINWGSIDAFWKQGFGFCTVHEHEVVSWSLTDCVSRNRCEIGIRTKPEYRHRGLATLTAAATVDYALTHGYSQVGWHTNIENYGSIGVAENVGFIKTRDYTWHYCMIDEATHLAETGLRRFLQGLFALALDSYEKAFAKGAVSYWYYHQAAQAAAALRKKQKALRLLNQAITEGWQNLEYTQECSEFDILHDTKDWHRLIKRMNS